MSNDFRPDPDKLLSLVTADANFEHRGKLKVFLGMAAGVGKTYAMLKAAHQAKAKGVDVVVGFVETYGRNETAEQLQGLEVLPRLKVLYKGVALEELDLDAVLRRKPQLVIIDELAHTNATGSRHAKRYLDILEVINSGIDVYTTVNIQHLQSRADTVHQITGVAIRETVPDSIFDQADEIILIDIPPEELLKRLKEGRIYPKERAEIAETHFFQKGNLTALREMALRLAAERVDRDLRDYKQLHGVDEAWKSSDRLAVAIFASPYSETLIKWTRRLADSMHASWIGVYVDTDQPISETEKTLLAKNISLVHQLGGEVITTRDDDPVNGILRVARQNNVTQIVIGKSKRGILTNLIKGGSIDHRLLRSSGDIDVYVMSASSYSSEEVSHLKSSRQFTFPFKESGMIFAIALFAWFLASALKPLLGYLAVGFIFLIMVSLSGLFLNWLSVFVLSVLLVLIHNFFFIPPRYTFMIHRPEDILMLVMFFLTAAITGRLTSRLKVKEKHLRDREERTLALYALTRELAKAPSIEEVASFGVNMLRKTVGFKIALFLDRGGHGQDRLVLHPASDFYPSEQDRAVAIWVLSHHQPAGKTTETLAAAEGYYLPLLGKHEALGVIGIQIANIKKLDADKNHLFETFVHLIAAAMERESFHEQAKILRIMEESQKLYKTLLDSVSHELNTPLAAIKGSASALLDETVGQNHGAVQNLSQEIFYGATRLQRFVENLLDMSRIESEVITPKTAPCSSSEIISSVLRELSLEIGERPIEVSFESDLPDLLCDPILTEQAIANIVQNALIYSPKTAPIEINSFCSAKRGVIRVRDHGAGLPVNEPERIFEKFYRAHPKHPGGVGLGLSIAKRLIELQQGSVSAHNHSEGGAVFDIFLPTVQSIIQSNSILGNPIHEPAIS